MNSQIFRNLKSFTFLLYFFFKENVYTKNLHREIYTGNLDQNEYLKKERFDKSFFKNVILFKTMSNYALFWSFI